MMNEQEVLQIYNNERENFQLECIYYRRVRARTNMSSMTEQEELLFYRAQKRYKAACKRFFRIRDDYKRIIATKIGSLPDRETDAELEKGIFQEVSNSNKILSGQLEQDIREAFPNKTEEEIRQMLETARRNQP